MTRLLRILALLFWLAAVVCLLSCGWACARDVNAWETPYRMAWRLRFDLMAQNVEANRMAIPIGFLAIAGMVSSIYYERRERNNI